MYGRLLFFCNEFLWEIFKIYKLKCIHLGNYFKLIKLLKLALGGLGFCKSAHDGFYLSLRHPVKYSILGGIG